MKKKLLALLLALVMLLSMVACGSPTNAPASSSSSPGSSTPATSDDPVEDSPAIPENPTEVYTLSVGTVVAEKTAVALAYEKIKEELYNRSNGAIVLDIYYHSTLGGTNELAEGLMLGTIDIAQINSATLSNYCEAINVLSLPYVFSNREHAKAAMEKYYDEILDGVEESLGTPLGIYEQGWRQFMNTKHTVATLEDFQGLTVRVQEGQLYFDTFNALGCIPTVVAVAELVTAMQQGVCDAHENPLATPVNQRHYEFAKYLTMTNHIFGTSVAIMSDACKERLPEPYLSLVLDTFEEFKWYSLEVGAELDAEFLATLEENGVEITYFSEAEAARVREAVSGVWDSFEDKDLLNGILEMQ